MKEARKRQRVVVWMRLMIFRPFVSCEIAPTSRDLPIGKSRAACDPRAFRRVRRRIDTSR